MREMDLRRKSKWGGWKELSPWTRTFKKISPKAAAWSRIRSLLLAHKDQDQGRSQEKVTIQSFITSVHLFQGWRQKQKIWVTENTCSDVTIYTDQPSLENFSRSYSPVSLATVILAGSWECSEKGQTENLETHRRITWSAESGLENTWSHVLSY